MQSTVVRHFLHVAMFRIPPFHVRNTRAISVSSFNINFCIVLLCSLDLALALALYCVYMTRERHVILKAALHSRLAV